MNDEEKRLINLHPEMNQSGCYDNEGNLLPKPKWEQYDFMPRGFINSGLISKLTSRDLYIYFFLSSKCYPSRNTWIRSDSIAKETRIPVRTIKESLKRLEFYHFISRTPYFTRLGINRSRRIITLLKWKTAYRRLVLEGKIKANSGEDKDPIIIPYKK